MSGAARQEGRSVSRPSGEPTLFDPLPALTLGQQSVTRAASRHNREIEQLVPLARKLARQAGSSGVTVADLRLHAEEHGLLRNQESGRRLSYLGAVMKAAGLVNTGL